MTVNFGELYYGKKYEEIIYLLNPDRSSNQVIPKYLTYYYLWSLYREFLKNQSEYKTQAENDFTFIASEIRRLEPNHHLLNKIIETQTIKQNSKKFKQRRYLNEYGFLDYHEVYNQSENDFDDIAAIEQGNL